LALQLLPSRFQLALATRWLRGADPTTSVHLPKALGVCVSPLAAEELLRAEGFTDVHYIETEAAGAAGAIGHGKLDFGLNYAPLRPDRVYLLGKN